MRTALITGITGQDGTYLAEHLLKQGYNVYGLIRGQNNPKREWVESIAPDMELVLGDLMDQTSLIRALEYTKPDEVYNLAAISYVALSWDQARLVGEVTGLGVLNMLEAVRTVGGCGRANGKRSNPMRFYQASSSEMYGRVREVPQSETTPFYPRSPYAVAKVYGHHITINYRESYDLYACSGILFNHESPRRGLEFVTRKISHAVARIKLGRQKELVLGNLDAKRDWGYAGDYIRAMHLMLQQAEPEDYVVGTGECHSVAEFAELAFACVGLNWQDYVRTDPRFLRPAEVEQLLSNPTKANTKLGWKPSVTFQQLVEMMVESDMAAEKERIRTGVPAGK